MKQSQTEIGALTQHWYSGTKIRVPTIFINKFGVLVLSQIGLQETNFNFKN
jgi:hypothetical protein